ncbi:hypothetical protein DYH09_32500 [bacterium CPR1]|nr:hypothetical protein [bacterium CPR1]
MPIVMFGDRGQADPEFIGQALERFPEHVRAGLIHRVRPLDPERLERCQRQGLLFFDTYVGAAIQLNRMGLLTAGSLECVVAAAWSDFEAIKFPDEAMRQARKAFGLALYNALERSSGAFVRLC